MISYRFVGNSLHAINLLNITVYGSMLYTFGTDPQARVFDKSWLRSGFCTPHEDVDYRTTHDISGHAMVGIAILGIFLQQYLSHQSTTDAQKSLAKADNLAFWAMIGALGHAFGHYFIAFAHREKFYPPQEETFLEDLRKGSFLVAIGKACPGYPFFWMPLVRTYMMNTAKGRVAIVAFICWFGSLFMQARFGFSYTQSVLFAGLSIDQLMLPSTQKGFEFALWPLITTIPSGMFAWVESMACSSSSAMQQHGHLVYDVYMASSYILFYAICWVHVNYTTIKTKTL